MMQNVSEIGPGPITVWMRLVSRSSAGVLEAETIMRLTDGVSVVEVSCRSDLSQCLRLSAPSAAVISRLAYRIAGLALIEEVRVQRCTDSPFENGSGTGPPVFGDLWHTRSQGQEGAESAKKSKPRCASDDGGVH
jgi:hypothetical protein